MTVISRFLLMRPPPATSSRGGRAAAVGTFATDALPAAGVMLLPAAQFYSDGTVTHWTELTLPAKAEPEHPVPAFTVTAPPATGVNSTSTPAAGVQASGTTPPAATTTDGTARVLGAAALLVGVIAAGLVLLGRRPPAGIK